MSLHIFGIRHHGPGCARSLRAALEDLQPDVVVMEGPADAADALPLVASDNLKPPVAMLLYPPDEPRRATYYPLAEYSPEYQALRWAAASGVPVEFMDLPQRHRLAMEIEEEKKFLEEMEQAAARSEAETTEETEAPYGDADAPRDAVDDHTEDTRAAASREEKDEDEPLVGDEIDPDDAENWRTDPLALLAQAAGYRDHELWWEEQVERREDATDLFDGICSAMQTVREHVPRAREIDLIREAYMRKTLRAVRKQYQHDDAKIAVVCGAWHAPVLDEQALAGKREGCSIKEDTARLKGLPKIKTKTTWIPWTYSRLTYASGYGAGVRSPGWYGHIWQSREKAPMRWIATAARLLRGADLDASSASVIEAIRLADALAAMRDLRSPGLAELSESILTVLCHGEHAPMKLIRNRLEIGDKLGEVPESAAAVPLARDLEQLQKSLRLKPTTEIKNLDLDLRTDNGLARSHLLHRLDILGIVWGTRQYEGGRASTFHEVWHIQWQPEFAVAIIEANVWGNTVEVAATAKAVSQAQKSDDLSEITQILDQAMLAGLSAAIDPLLARVQEQAAIASDVRHLMDGLPPLARVARYGDVRGTQAKDVEPVIVGMFERAIVGLPAACSSLDDDAAERMLHSIGNVQQSLDVLHRNDLAEDWSKTLRRLLQGDFHGLLRGWCCRLLLEKGEIEDDELYRLTRLALSTANDPAEAAVWATGLLRGSGLLLLHQDAVWQVFDQWLSELTEEQFRELLPLVRRAFSDFSGPERRQMGEKVKNLPATQAGLGGSRGKGSTATTDQEINWDRAKKVLPVLAHILGVEYRE